MGDSVAFRATHFFIRQNLTSKVVEYERPKRMVDQMTKGAFKTFTHIHEFKTDNGGTMMTDIISFEVLFGVFGKVVEQLVLKFYLKKFILHRGKQIKKIAEAK
ncbi:SRPBCC family protein [Cohnella thermotolerans]|uniref:SRPBCC family protein n=1 Tax=Cohnella thermotolerans TaxID=329858 RepID=UPI0006850079|nr:SRPBCC family protein [Cohnella thermotolerans]